MNKKQATEQISALFESAFDRETYTHFLRNLLNDIEARDNHYSGNTVPDAYKPHVNQYWRIGKYVDPEQAEVDLYVVEVPTLAKLDRARTALRNFAVRTLKTFGDKDHALIAFYAKEDGGADWRFSYVKIEHSAKMVDGKAKVEKELTPAKRYSFLVGVHERSHTAQTQLVELLAMDYANPKVGGLEAAFSIEKVTKEFFEQYKGLFLQLSEVLAGDAYFNKETDEEKRKQQVAKFAKKLLGQIVFLYFLQKKGWMGVPEGVDWGKGDRRFLQKLFSDADDAGQNYYLDKLQYLFYEALANDRKDQFDPTYYQRFECRIPFLNGGLFEADYDWQKIAIALPNSIFSNAEKTKAGDNGTGILDVFNRYNFTIKEDEPLDKEVAIDPEMLGKVFENMLEITERKSKGAYYTPREIVHYMCQESLIHYLAGEVGEETKSAIPKVDVETLVRKGIFAIENDQRILDKGKETEAYTFKLPESVRANAERIDDALADIRVCDPAIGSGAFPVGMLHEIVHARQALAPHLPQQRRLRPYDLKKHTIGHSLYGVDLDPSAIDIARLRLWLSLVVDEDDYTVIDALPNLDYKIMQGNSLIEEYEGIKLFDESFIQEADDPAEQIAALQQEEQEISRNYIALSQQNKLSKDQKKAFDKRLKEIKKLADKLKNPPKEKAEEPGLFDLVSKAREKATELEQLHEQFFAVSSPGEKRKLRDQITALEWELIEATLTEQKKTSALSQLANFKDSGEKPWFLWRLNFSEVFKQKGGFDVVMGNPPYVQIQSFSGQQIQKDMEAQKYDTFTKTGDIYCLFYERGHRILRDHAALCFITSNKWMRAKYGEKTRQFFADKTVIRQLIDFGDSPIFSEATTYTNIMLFEKGTAEVDQKVWDLTSCYQKQTSLLSMLKQQGEGYASFDVNSYVIVNPQMARIKQRIEAVGTPLKDWDVSIYRGILTGFNEAFIIDGKKKDELIAADPKSAEIIKPILRGRDIKRYRADFADLWLINSHNGCGDVPPIDINDYPAVKAYLDQHWEKLERRQDKGVTPYNLRNCAYLPEFENEKIVWLEMSPRPNFTFIVDEIYVLNTSYILTGKRLEALLAVINSSVLDFYFPMIATDVRGKTRRYIKQYVEVLPIASGFNDGVAQNLTTYVRILKVHDRHLQSSYFEQLIDGLVYELYFPDEIKAAEKEILLHLGDLPPLGTDMTEEEKLAVIQREFERLYDPNHPVRNHLETLDSVEEVRIIREALKR